MSNIQITVEFRECLKPPLSGEVCLPAKGRGLLNHISSRSGVATSSGPFGMEEFAAWFIKSFVGVSSEIVALSL